MSDYKPTEHDGLRQDSQPDKRVGTHEFAQGKVDPVDAGKKGGSVGGTSASDDTEPSSATSTSSSGGKHKPSENGGRREDGEPDGRMKQ